MSDHCRFEDKVRELWEDWLSFQGDFPAYVELMRDKEFKFDIAIAEAKGIANKPVGEKLG